MVPHQMDFWNRDPVRQFRNITQRIWTQQSFAIVSLCIQALCLVHYTLRLHTWRPELLESRTGIKCCVSRASFLVPRPCWLRERKRAMGTRMTRSRLVFSTQAVTFDLRFHSQPRPSSMARCLPQMLLELYGRKRISWQSPQNCVCLLLHWVLPIYQRWWLLLSFLSSRCKVPTIQMDNASYWIRPTERKKNISWW